MGVGGVNWGATEGGWRVVVKGVTVGVEDDTSDVVDDRGSGCVTLTEPWVVSDGCVGVTLPLVTVESTENVGGVVVSVNAVESTENVVGVDVSVNEVCIVDTVSVDMFGILGSEVSEVVEDSVVSPVTIFGTFVVLASG